MSREFKNWKSLDYICGWFYLAQKYCKATDTQYAFVSTNSICQGQNIANFWQVMDKFGTVINFAVLSFKWNNLASKNAGVTVVIVGSGSTNKPQKYIYQDSARREVDSINAYLVEGQNVWIDRMSQSISDLSEMLKGNYYGLSDGLLMNESEMLRLKSSGLSPKYIKTFKGSDELIKGKLRYCLWFVKKEEFEESSHIDEVYARVEDVRLKRLESPDPMAIKMAETPFKFREMRIANKHSISVPVVSSENRGYLPVFLEDKNVVYSNAAFALYDAPLWNLAIVASKLHLVWISTVCGQLETRLRYSNTLGWNTFPLPKLTEKNKADLTRCAEDILLARETHFPSTIADLYDPENMPENLRRAHEHNDETLERIYIGRHFKNDTERLEKLFELYTKMTTTINKAN